MSLQDWFGKGPKGDWVDIGAPKKDGKFQACGRAKVKGSKRKFKVYPSAYANAYASKICAGKIKDPSGVKRKDFKGPKPKSSGTSSAAKKIRKVKGGGFIARRARLIDR